MTRLHEGATWQPVVNRLATLRPDGLPWLMDTTRISPGGVGGGRGFEYDHSFGDFDEIISSKCDSGRFKSGLHDEQLLDMYLKIRHDCPDNGILVQVRVPDGRVIVIGPDERLDFGLSGGAFDSVTLALEARPGYHRPLAPRPDAPISPHVDIPAMLAVLQSKDFRDTDNSQREGATDMQLDATEAALGTPLTAELRALYSYAKQGDFFTEEPEYDEEAEEPEDEEFDDWVLCLVPLDPDSQRRRDYTYSSSSHFSKWKYDSERVVWDDQDGRVHLTAGSPYWFPFAHDYGGNYFSIDLAPGPNGHLGQVLFHDRDEGWAGAIVAADSLTDFIVNRRGYPAGHDRLDKHGRLTISAEAKRRNSVNVDSLQGVDVSEIEVLDIKGSVPPVDLQPFLGSPRLRTLTIETLPADPRQLLQLPALEYLSTNLATWQLLWQAQAIPPQLAAIGFEGNSTWEELLPATNAILGLRGQPPINAVSLMVPPQ